MGQNLPGMRVPAIFRPAVLLFDGISGRDRRRARHLKDDLESLRQQSQQFDQERSSLHQEVAELRGRLKSSTLELQQELNQRLAETERLKRSLRELRQDSEASVVDEQSRQADLQRHLQEKSEQCDRLIQKVTALEAAQKELQTDMAEMEEWVQQVGVENTALGQENDSLRQAQVSQDAYFKSVVSQLEAFEQRLRNANADAWKGFGEVWKSFSLNEMLFPVLPDTAVSMEELDLSSLNVALVGGHDSTRRGVIDMLLPYGLNSKSVVEIPPASQNKISQSRVKAKIQHCNLVVIIAGYLSHKLTDIIDNLKSQDALTGELLYLNCRGSSGVAREILLHLQNQQ